MWQGNGIKKFSEHFKLVVIEFLNFNIICNTLSGVNKCWEMVSFKFVK